MKYFSNSQITLIVQMWPKFVIPNVNADTSTLKVTIQNSNTDSTQTNYF